MNFDDVCRFSWIKIEMIDYKYPRGILQGFLMEISNFDEVPTYVGWKYATSCKTNWAIDGFWLNFHQVIKCRKSENRDKG